MTLATFAPSIDPSPGSTYKPAVKMLAADFGDGYSQPTPDGINNIKMMLGLAWDMITVDQKNELDAFFTAQGGGTPFYFSPFGDNSDSTPKWTCSEWSYKSVEGNFSFSANLVQTFSNAV